MKKVDPRLHEKLAQAVGRERDPSTLHHRICDLVERTYLPTVVTTNWDQLLEKAAERQGTPFKVWPITKRGRMSGRQAHGVIHLNGSVENPKAMLATRQELLDHYGREEEQAFIEGLVEDRTILCVGYSHNDEMIGEIVRRTRQAGVQTEIITIIQEGNGEKETEVKKSMLEEHWRAEIIWYPWADRHHDSVKSILSRITKEEEENAGLEKDGEHRRGGEGRAGARRGLERGEEDAGRRGAGIRSVRAISRRGGVDNGRHDRAGGARKNLRGEDGLEKDPHDHVMAVRRDGRAGRSRNEEHPAPGPYMPRSHARADAAHLRDQSKRQRKADGPTTDDGGAGAARTGHGRRLGGRRT